MNDNYKLEGIIPPIVTPFYLNEDINENAFRSEIEYYIKAGVNGIICGGATGEGQTLSQDEFSQLLEIAVNQVNGRIPVICGIIPDSTREALNLAHKAQAIGADAILLTVCHFYRSTEKGLYDYFKRINDETELPIVIYDTIPSPIVNMDSELIVKIASLKNVVAMKQSLGDIHKMAEIIQLTHGQFQIFSAIDDLLFPSFVLGARGSMGAITVIFPELIIKMYKAVCEGRIGEAREIHSCILPLIKIIFKRPNYQSWVKTTLKLLGHDVGVARHPCCLLEEEELSLLKRTLKEVGALE